MAEGFVKFPRWMFSDEVLNHDEVYWCLWCRLMANANYADGTVIFNGKPMTIHKNQLIVTRKKLKSFVPFASESKIERVLNNLEKAGYIEQHKNRQGRLVSLVFSTSTQKSEQLANNDFDVFSSKPCTNGDTESEQQMNSQKPLADCVSEVCLSESEQQMNNKRTTDEQQTDNRWTQNNKNKESKKNKEGKKDILSRSLDPVKSVVDYLNEKCGTKYEHSSAETQRLIVARLNQGFGLEDFKRVIDNKVADWGNDSQMSKFLRPQTLFSNKFESYLNQSVTVQNKSVDSWRDKSFDIEDVSGFHPLPDLPDF